jgi:hypothetical protein
VKLAWQENLLKYSYLERKQTNSSVIIQIPAPNIKWIIYTQ